MEFKVKLELQVLWDSRVFKEFKGYWVRPVLLVPWGSKALLAPKVQLDKRVLLEFKAFRAFKDL
jgi:hypothetical protein